MESVGLGREFGLVGEAAEGGEAGVGVVERFTGRRDGGDVLGELLELDRVDDGVELWDGEVVLVADVEGVGRRVEEVAAESLGEWGSQWWRGFG